MCDKALLTQVLVSATYVLFRYPKCHARALILNMLKRRKLKFTIESQSLNEKNTTRRIFRHILGYHAQMVINWEFYQYVPHGQNCGDSAFLNHDDNLSDKPPPHSYSKKCTWLYFHWVINVCCKDSATLFLSHWIGLEQGPKIRNIDFFERIKEHDTHFVLHAYAYICSCAKLVQTFHTTYLIQPLICKVHTPTLVTTRERKRSMFHAFFWEKKKHDLVEICPATAHEIVVNSSAVFGAKRWNYISFRCRIFSKHSSPRISFDSSSFVRGRS